MGFRVRHFEKISAHDYVTSAREIFFFSRFFEKIFLLGEKNAPEMARCPIRIVNESRKQR